MITFCVICYGCRGKQINRALLQLHFSSSHYAHISQTLALVFFLCVSSLVENTYVCEKPVSYQNLMRNPTSEYTWAIFKSFFHVTALPSVLLIPLPLMFSVCLANWPQMPGLYKEKYIFLSCNVPGKPRI